MKKLLTLVFFLKEEQVLLGFKQRGFGKERWNGFGGKVEVRETIEDAAKREALEECGLLIKVLEKRAVHQFSFEGSEDLLEVHTFLALAWEGEPRETEEMRPQWFPLEGIPYASMWPDDALWLPQFLAGKKLITRFHFGAGDTVLEYDVREVSDI